MVAFRNDGRRSAVGLIAPCGINCGRCLGHRRAHNPCPGCRVDDPRKPKTRAHCKIKDCRKRRGKFCGDCASFPCALLSRLATRYRAKYATDLLGNLRRIRAGGVRRFAADEKIAWTCADCGNPICLHTGTCLFCEMAKNPSR